jgi:ribosomal protein S3AE
MAIKKKFFAIEIPLTNSSVDLLAYNIESLDKRTVKLDLTRQLRGKSIEVVFRVQIEGDKAIANPTKLTLLPFFIRRMLRKNISYVEDSFSTNCKDAQMRVKPFLITRKKISRKVRKALREEAKTWLIDYIKDKSYKEVFSDIIGNRVQKPLSLKLKKIYPLALCEIRVLKIEKLKEQEKLKITVEKVAEKQEKKK